MLVAHVTLGQRHRPIIKTIHRAFNELVTEIHPGVIQSKAIVSRLVRSYWTMRDADGTPATPGKLRDEDLIDLKIPKRYLSKVHALCEYEDVYIYRAQHYCYKVNGYVVHGFIVTNANTDKLLLIQSTGPSSKSWFVLEVLSQYISRS